MKETERRLQYEIFLESEADNYHERNKEVIKKINYANDFPIRLLEMYNILPKKVLEIGSSLGSRLNYINQKYGADCTGIDPSKDAVNDGNSLFKNIQIKQGVFSNVPLEDKFDLIIVNFVFHWIDRDLMAKCVSEIERLLLPDGFLLLGDFFPNKPIKNKYHYLPEEDFWTYKQNYTKLFLSLENYILIALVTTNETASSTNQQFVIEKDVDNRVFYSLLMKM